MFTLAVLYYLIPTFFITAIFIGIPVAIYDKTVEVSSKYTLTRFLIAWPMRLSMSLLSCGALIVLSFLPITIVTTVVGVMLNILFNFSDKYVEYAVYGILILNAVWLIRGIVITTVKQFVNDLSGKTKKPLSPGDSLQQFIDNRRDPNKVIEVPMGYNRRKYFEQMQRELQSK